MREIIYFAPGAAGNELIKNLAVYGVNCINLRIMGAAELAEYALMRSGVTVSEEFVSPREECTLIAKAVAGNTYFGKTTYEDIKRIAGAVKRMRGLVTDAEEDRVLTETLEKGLFAEKNAALLETYHRYMQLLEDQHALDSIALVRKAVAEAKQMAADFVILKEYPLSPLEMALLQQISGGTYREAEIAELYQAPKADLKLAGIRNCYGASNEVETILNDIYAGKSLDQCTVAVTDVASYAQLFYDYALLYNLPITFGCGVPIVNSYPAQLLVTYYRWMTDGYFGRDALDALLNSKAMNKKAWNDQFPAPQEGLSRKLIKEVMGNLRLTNDAAKNAERLAAYRKAIAEEEAFITEADRKAYQDLTRRKMCIPYLEIAARELALPMEDFIVKYAYIRKGSERSADMLVMKVDMAALQAIYEELGIIRRAGLELSGNDLVKTVLRIGVCGENCTEGKLHITDLNGAFAATRKNLYLAGLSASLFPGSPKEDYLLLDADLELFGTATGYLSAEGKIRKKREQFMSLAHLASGLGNNVYVSYAGLNVSELKKANASSMIFELFREASGQNVTAEELESHIEKIDYFAPAISASREIGKAYNQGEKIAGPEFSFDRDLEVSAFTDREWSPSAINLFLTDTDTFILQYLLGIQQPDDIDLFAVINPMAAGTLAHSLMERLANSDMTLEEFLNISEAAFDRYLDQNPPVIPGKVAEAKDDFLDMMETAYRQNPKREVALKEEDIHCTHESGIRIFGYPDRVEKLEDGSYLIVDFKSGRNVKHMQDDITTCLQVVLYAYLLEQKGYQVAGGEFRYLRTGDIITCRYDEDMKEKLNDVLLKFRQALEHFDFTETVVNMDDEADEEGDE